MNYCTTGQMWARSGYLGAVFNLTSADHLYVNVSELSLVNFEESKTFFGLYKLWESTLGFSSLWFLVTGTESVVLNEGLQSTSGQEKGHEPRESWDYRVQQVYNSSSLLRSMSQIGGGLWIMTKKLWAARWRCVVREKQLPGYSTLILSCQAHFGTSKMTPF